jgi:hypothetical protein
MGLMGSIRGYLRTAAALALISLAIQCAASFGHLHLEHWAAGDTHTARPLSQPVADPATGDHGEDERCDLCAVIQLAGTALLPDAPQPILLPFSPDPVWSPASESLRAQTATAFFHARAPPRA